MYEFAINNLTTERSLRIASKRVRIYSYTYIQLRETIRSPHFSVNCLRYAIGRIFFSTSHKLYGDGLLLLSRLIMKLAAAPVIYLDKIAFEFTTRNVAELHYYADEYIIIVASDYTVVITARIFPTHTYYIHTYIRVHCLYGLPAKCTVLRSSTRQRYTRTRPNRIGDFKV